MTSLSLFSDNDDPTTITNMDPEIQDGVNSIDEWFLSFSSANYKRLIEKLPVLFYVVDSKAPHTPLYVSPAFRRLGYPLKDWLNDPTIWNRVIHPDDRQGVFDRTADSTRSGKDFDHEYRVIASDGQMLWVRDRGTLIRDDLGNVICREGIMLDITVRKETEAALQQSEKKYRALVENANDIVYIHDLDGNYISVNKAAERVFGYSISDILSMNMSQIAVPEQLPLVRKMLRTKLLGSKSETSYELDCIQKNGTVITLEVNSSIVRKGGKPVAVQGIARDVTERKITEEALRESEVRYRDLFENANDLIYTHDLDGHITSLNRAGERISGYTREEALKMNIADVVAPEHLALATEMTFRKMESRIPSIYQLDIIAKDGRRVGLELSTRLIVHQNKAVGVQGIARDITERRRSEDIIRANETRYRQLSDGISHQVWAAEPDGRLNYVNSRTMEYFNLSAEHIIGNGWHSVVHPDDLAEGVKRWAHCLRTGEFYEVEFRLRRHDGEYRWHKARAVASTDQDGKITGWLGTNTDIDDQKQSEAKLNFYARHDTLTDLPNRAEFMSHLKAAIDRSRSNDQAHFAVLFLDVDRFKVINDSLGHMVGDSLLKEIAKRLIAQVRPGDYVARLGGDEFTILLNRTGDHDDIIHVAERIQANLTRPFMIAGNEVFTSVSIGIIIADDIERGPEDFLRDADSAMYRAKESGKARYEIFNREMHVKKMNVLSVENDLRHAIERNEFEVFYQPIVDLETCETREFEALIRWRHPTRGLVPPDSFVPVAEETGLIIPIGRWILQQATYQLAKWQKMTLNRLAISVNLSAKQLVHPSLTGQVLQILKESGLEPDQLKLEVTESTVMEHSERSLSVLNELKSLGISLSTDDFGTGYSSLSYLQQFPFDRLKIDRSFIQRMMDDAKSAAIVKTILMLGSNLGTDVVAEGIETASQLDLLKTLGCKYGQGFLFSCPIIAENAEEMVGGSLGGIIVRTPPQTSSDILEVPNIQ